jgi:hypothetical protein
MPFLNYTGMSIDLIANIANRDSTKKKLVDDFLRKQDDNPFNENSLPNVSQYGELACGDVVLGFAQKLWGIGNVSKKFNSYHNPILPKPTNATFKWENIKYKESELKRASGAIRNLLEKGTPVRVGAVYLLNAGMIAANGALQPNLTGGHFILIVGCDAKGEQFLYMDPYPNMSNSEYAGRGDTENLFSGVCHFLGVMTLQSTASRGSFFRKSSTTSGDYPDLEIMAGP